MNSKTSTLMWICIIALMVSACAQKEARIVYVTATANEILETDEIEMLPTSSPVPAPTGVIAQERIEEDNTYTVETGDTLSGIALEFNTSVDYLLEINGIENPDIIEVGQVIQLPPPVTQRTPNIKLLVNSRFIRQSEFNVREFIEIYGGSIIKQYKEEIVQRSADGSPVRYTLDAAGVIEEISTDFSVDARLLMSILEYQAQYISSDNIEASNQQFPLIAAEDSEVERSGLYRQLSWAANELNRGYYRARYFTEQPTLEFSDGIRILVNSDTNAATSALQYFFSLNKPYNQWLDDIDQSGFIQTYSTFFGDPLDGNDFTTVAETPQPKLTLPFEIGDIWYFTGGSHGGWANGSAWSAIDFAPPDNNNLLCYESDYWITAVGDGVIARSERGAVVLDLDGDGNESTGWNIVYLHVASQDRIATGVEVIVGDRIGHASCEGGYSTATHLHIARKYNGEWIPADCSKCNNSVSSFTMSGWSVVSIPGQEYQGYLVNSVGDSKIAEQGRNTTINQIQLEDSE